MSGKDNGGPAFPFEGGMNNNHQPNYGMTLRDYFAAKAMQSMLSTGEIQDGTKVADAAYFYADAMIAGRAK